MSGDGVHESLDRPLVSILIVNFNYEDYLGDAIRSALEQTYPRVEVIVIDDGSMDSSRAVVASFGNKIKAILKSNGGQHSAWNAGFAASRGEILCFLDSDDFFLRNKVEEIVKIYRTKKAIGWCFHRLRYYDTTNKCNLGTLGEEASREVDLIERIKKWHCPMPYIPVSSGMTFRRDFLSRFFPLPETDKHSGDLYIKFVSLALSKGFLLSQALAVNRIHGHNAASFLPVKEAAVIRARERIKTALLVQETYPELQTLSSGLFASALGHYWYAREKAPDIKALLERYQKKLNVLQEAISYMKALKCYFELSCLDSNKPFEKPINLKNPSQPSFCVEGLTREAH